MKDGLTIAADRLGSLLNLSPTVTGVALQKLADEKLIEVPAQQPLVLLPLVATTDAAEAYALAVVSEINRLTGRHFKVTAETVTRAKALLRARIKVDTTLAVVRFKAGTWGKDPKMAEYIQPSTLMRLSKVKEYIGQMEAGPARVNGGGETFKQLGDD